MSKWYVREYHADMIYDFSDFLNKQSFPDCALIFPDGTEIKAHKIIVGSASTFLLNAFTSGMEEEKTGVVSMTYNPQDLLRSVIEFMYSSEIVVNDDNIMSLINISFFYGISTLYDFLQHILEQKLNISNIFFFVDKCYELELREALAVLEPYMANHYKEIPITLFSEKLDIATFCRVLHFAVNQRTFDGNVIAELNIFLNGTIPTPEQKEVLNKLAKTYNCRDVLPCW